VIKVRFISLVNLIMDREVVRELIQEELSLRSLHRELAQILVTGYRHGMMKKDYRELREILGGTGASERVAADMVAALKPKNGE